MKNIAHICVLLIFLRITRAEIRCKDSATDEEYILNPTDFPGQMESFISETNEKLKYLTEHLDKQCNEVHTKIPVNCYEALKNTHYTGIHEILVPTISSKPFEVFCDDDTYYGGWTVIARRIDGSTDFYRNWIEYKKGFGNLNGEFFIGLDALHAMTSGGHKQELLIKLRNFDDTTKYAKYNKFEIGNETEGYALKVLGTYAGDAGDALTYHIGQKFTTKDKDNDQHEKENCAVEFKGAWWYRNCYESCLFASYESSHKAFGITWLTFSSKMVNLKFVEMLIRPVIV